MGNFKFVLNEYSNKWVVVAPGRAKRTHINSLDKKVCPFCPESTVENKEVYRVPSIKSTTGITGKNYDWQVRVLENKYPFAPVHEVIIHSPDHDKNFDTQSTQSTELVLQTYRSRYLVHQKKGSVYIFHNRGKNAGESIAHPHTQLVVIPPTVTPEIPRLAKFSRDEVCETYHFNLVCPAASQWPDEVWIVPKGRGRTFGEITDAEIGSLSHALSRLIHINSHRYGDDFSFNFYIYPGKDWYMRFVPRQKVLGGFEVGTGIYVNTHDPKVTLAFLEEQFHTPDIEKIKLSHKAEYDRSV